MSNLSINIPILARVEGEGSLTLQIHKNKVSQLALRIYEPPRLFEKFLEGRHYHEVLDFVARICGICPVAYQMSAVIALESILKITPSPWVIDMRRLFYCGEWIESHSLHIHFLAIPDFLNYQNALDIAKDQPEIIHRGIRLQKLGNDIIKLLGGRSVHPVGATIGGFYHAPLEKMIEPLLARLHSGLDDAIALVEWIATLSFPEQSQSFVSVALQHPSEYAINAGKIISDTGLNIESAEFANHFKEEQVPYSTALHCKLDGKNYLVGPLARLNLNYQHLPARVKSLIDKSGIRFPTKNIFHSIFARAIEVTYAITESIRILEQYQVSTEPYISSAPRAGVGFGATEAPRGLLWQQYKLDDNGMVQECRVVPPTSQNQGRIEEDLRMSVDESNLLHDKDALRLFCEKIIRNYDPCISCSTHFLDLRVIEQ